MVSRFPRPHAMPPAAVTAGVWMARCAFTRASQASEPILKSGSGWGVGCPGVGVCRGGGRCRTTKRPQKCPPLQRPLTRTCTGPGPHTIRGEVVTQPPCHGGRSHSNPDPHPKLFGPRLGGGGRRGVRGTPTCVPQNDPLVALITLNTCMRGVYKRISHWGGRSQQPDLGGWGGGGHGGNGGTWGKMGGNGEPQGVGGCGRGRMIAGNLAEIENESATSPWCPGVAWVGGYLGSLLFTQSSGGENFVPVLRAHLNSPQNSEHFEHTHKRVK